MRELVRRPYVPERGLTQGSCRKCRRCARSPGADGRYAARLRPQAARRDHRAARRVKRRAPPRGGLLGRLATEAVRKGAPQRRPSPRRRASSPMSWSARCSAAPPSLLTARWMSSCSAPPPRPDRSAARVAEQTAVKLAMLDYPLTLRGSELAQELERLSRMRPASWAKGAARLSGERHRGDRSGRDPAGAERCRCCRPDAELRHLLESAGALKRVAGGAAAAVPAGHRPGAGKRRPQRRCPACGVSRRLCRRPALQLANVGAYRRCLLTEICYR